MIRTAVGRLIVSLVQRRGCRVVRPPRRSISSLGRQRCRLREHADRDLRQERLPVAINRRERLERESEGTAPNGTCIGYRRLRIDRPC